MKIRCKDWDIPCQSRDMKRITAIAATMVLLLLVLIMAGGCDSNMKKTKYQNLSLQSFSIETGGGMNGGKNILRVHSSMENDIVAVYKLVNDTWYLNPRAELYVVDGSLLDEIKQIVIDEKLYNAPKVPLSKMQVLDANTTSYRVSFSEGECFSYSSCQELSSKIYDANNKIKAVIEEYCVNATAYPTVYAEAEGDYVFWKEQEGVTIDCSNEAPFQVNLNIYNGKGDNVKLTGNVTLSKMDGDKVVYTDTLVDNFTVEVYAEAQEYITVTLPFDHYPEEGTYKMAYAGYETAFEMKVYKAK